MWDFKTRFYFLNRFLFKKRLVAHKWKDSLCFAEKEIHWRLINKLSKAENVLNAILNADGIKMF